MKVSWLFESDRMGVSIAQIVEEIQRQGMDVKYADYIPYEAGKTYLDLFPPNACVVFYGTLGFSRQLHRETTWIPGTFHTENNFLCTTYYPHFSKYLLAENYQTYKYGDLLNNKDKLYLGYGQDNAIFVRPNSGEKIFTGQLIYEEEFESVISRLGYEPIPNDELVIVTEPRNIELEYRFIVADGKVIAGSKYVPLRLRLTSYEQQVWDYAQSVVDDVKWCPDRIYTLDVCMTKALNFYVLEVNSFSCAGFYACNPKPIVEHASRIALEEWEKVHG